MRPLRKAILPLNPLKILNTLIFNVFPLGLGQKNIEYQYFTLFGFDLNNA